MMTFKRRIKRNSNAASQKFTFKEWTKAIDRYEKDFADHAFDNELFSKNWKSFALLVPVFARNIRSNSVNTFFDT